MIKIGNFKILAVFNFPAKFLQPIWSKCLKIGPHWLCYFAGKLKTAPMNFIFEIFLGWNNSFEVKICWDSCTCIFIVCYRDFVYSVNVTYNYILQFCPHLLKMVENIAGFGPKVWRKFPEHMRSNIPLIHRFLIYFQDPMKVDCSRARLCLLCKHNLCKQTTESPEQRHSNSPLIHRSLI